MNTPYSMYEIDQRKKLITLSDFENQNPRILWPPTLFHDLSEIFKNRFPRELDQNFDILRISMIHWIRYNFLKYINRPRKKVKSIFNPGIQPTHLNSDLDIEDRGLGSYLKEPWYMAHEGVKTHGA